MSEKELKPCPFCGNEFPTITYNSIINVYSVNCPQCHAIFRLDCTAGRYSDKNKVIEAWNNRNKLRGVEQFGKGEQLNYPAKSDS